MSHTISFTSRTPLQSSLHYSLVTYRTTLIQRAPTLTTKVSIGDSEVERTKALGRYNPGSILEISKNFLKHVVDIRAEGEIVYENNGGRGDPLAVLLL